MGESWLLRCQAPSGRINKKLTTTALEAPTVLTFMHTYARTHREVHSCTYRNVCLHTYARTHAHTHARAQAHARAEARHIYAHIPAQAHTNAYMHPKCAFPHPCVDKRQTRPSDIMFMRRKLRGSSFATCIALIMASHGGLAKE